MYPRLRLTPRTVAPTPKQPRRAACVPTRAPHLTRAAQTARSRSAPARVGQFRSQCGTHAAPPCKAFQGRIEPRASRAHPLQTRLRALNPCEAARVPPEPVHTRQPLAGVCPCPAPRHAQPRRARGAAPKRRSPTDARRTFEEPPRTCRERARERYAGARALARVTWRHDGHNLSCDTCSVCAAQTRVVNVPQPRSTPLKRCSTPHKPPLSPP